MAVSRPVAKWIVDGLFTITILFIIVASYVGWIIPYRQGFHCDDPALQYKFQGDTISLAMLLSICAFVPLAFIIITETLRQKVVLRPSDPLAPPPIHKNGNPVRRVSFYFYYTYLHGLLCVTALVEFLKMTVGGLRPHFFDTCQPDFTKINCSSGLYITSYTCTSNISTIYLSDTFKSFPSGHAALSLYMALFLCFYVSKQLFAWPTSLTSSLTQTILLFWSGYCSASRLIDHRHHWWDVVAGCILGVVCACHTAIWLWVKLPADFDTSRSSSTLNSKQSNEGEPRYQRRRLLSSQASQTTELSETNVITTTSSSQQTNHLRV